MQEWEGEWADDTFVHKRLLYAHPRLEPQQGKPSLDLLVPR